MKILVIDDDTLVRRALEALLTGEGHEVICAEDGRKGIEAYHRGRPDVVITDIIMPEQEGIETLIKLRKIDPALRIVAISGGGRIGPTDVLRMASQFGADATVKKPFTAEALIAALGEPRAA